MKNILTKNHLPPRPKTVKTVSLIVPCYNEQESLPYLFKELKKLAEQIKKEFKLDSEFIFVNDGSSDKTEEMLNKFIKNHKGRVINFSRNFGQQSAITVGYLYSHGDIAITLDADLQDPPRVVLKMIKKYLEDKSLRLVLARRKKRLGETEFKKYTAEAYYWLLARLSNIKIPRRVADFRLIDVPLAKWLAQEFTEGLDIYWRGLVMFPGAKHAFVSYVRKERVKGVTHYSFAKMFKLATNGLVDFISSNNILLVFLFAVLGLFVLQWEGLFAFWLVFSAVLFYIFAIIIRSYKKIRGWPTFIIKNITEGK